VKFQIITEAMGKMEAVASGHTHIAYCYPPSWVYPGLVRFAGDSKQDAIGRVVRFIRDELDQRRPKCEMTEVDIQPSELAQQLDRGDSP
jgi:hypothetical protein